MPVLTDVENELIMEAILALRGKASKKQKDEFQNGKLRVKRGPLRYGRLNEPVEDLVGKLSSRVNASATDLLTKFKTKANILEKLFCPNCQHHRSTQKLKMHSMSQASNLLCESCGQVTFAYKWSCCCGLKWQKCEVHEFQIREAAPPRLKRKANVDPWGGDQPMPKLRRQTRATRTKCAASPTAAEPIRVALPPGSKLASRFPHLVKNAVADQRAAAR